MIAGFLVAIAAAACYEVAYIIQALAARREEGGEKLQTSLIGRLLRRPLWLFGTALSGVAVLLQVFALTLAPLTVVQPTLALGLVGMLVLARVTLHEHVGAREWLGVAGIVAGVAAIAVIGPEEGSGNTRSIGLAILLALLAAVTLAPYVWHDPRLRVYAAAAGDAAAAIALALVAEALGDEDWIGVVAWGAGAAVMGVLALNAEMSALQRLAAAHVAPMVLAAQVVIPVAAAPLLLGQPWGTEGAATVGLIVAVAVVAVGAAVLGGSKPVGETLARRAEPAAADAGPAR